jgi:hypothetical protein
VQGEFIIILKEYDPQLVEQILELSRIERRPENEGTRVEKTRDRYHWLVNRQTGSTHSIIDVKSPEDERRRIEPQSQALVKRPVPIPETGTGYLTTDLLNENLIKGYLVSGEDKAIPPLQLRRTLDQYFYNHLKSTSQRDSDQVVYRHTKMAFEPKIFMVDQLWLWIFDDGNMNLSK